jgi:hypothetical protein
VTEARMSEREDREGRDTAAWAPEVTRTGGGAEPVRLHGRQRKPRRDAEVEWGDAERNPGRGEALGLGASEASPASA